jgi:hypothetical protein
LTTRSQAFSLGTGLVLLAAAVVVALPTRAGAPVQEVHIHLRLSGRPHGTTEERERLRDLESDVMAKLAETRLGTWTRDAWPPGECIVYLSGASARDLWTAVEPVVRGYRPRPGSYAVLRAGGPGAREERVELGGP